MVFIKKILLQFYGRNDVKMQIIVRIKVNVILFFLRSFRAKPDHLHDYSQYSLDRKLQKKCSQPTNLNPNQASAPTPRHHPSERRSSLQQQVLQRRPELITVHRTGYDTSPRAFQPNHMKQNEVGFVDKERKGPEEHFGSFRRIKREFGRTSNR